MDEDSARFWGSSCHLLRRDLNWYLFTGPSFLYDRIEKDGILYLISKGGGTSLTSLKDRGGYSHSVWISVQKEEIEGEGMDLGGQIQERFVIE